MSRGAGRIYRGVPTIRGRKLTDEQRDFAGRHLHLCEEPARRFARRYPLVGLEEFEQVAFLGLSDAVKLFDERRGTPFETFAGCLIHRMCRDHAARAGPCRVPPAAWSRGVRLVPLADAEVPPSPDADPRRDIDDRDAFEGLLRGLKPMQESVVRRLYGPGGLSRREVARELRMSERAAQHAHVKALETIRWHMGATS